MIELGLVKVLHKLCNNLNTDEVVWAVTGSLGFALHGMDIEIHDVDIQTDKSGAYEIERRFLPYVVRNVEFSSSHNIRSYFGELNIDGVKVEIMGDIQKLLPDGLWESPVDVCDNTCLINCEGVIVPVMSLEHECEEYYKLGRTEKANQIRTYWEKHVAQSHKDTGLGHTDTQKEG